MNCEFQSRIFPAKDNGRYKCALGYFGGKCFLNDCLKCVKEGKNTKESADKFFADHEKHFPEKHRGITGCC